MIELNTVGLNQSIRELRQASQNKLRAAKEAHRDLGQDVKRAAERKAPVDTGALAGSGQVSDREFEDGQSVNVTFGGGAVDYAGIVHADNPFLTEAANEVMQNQGSVIGRAMEDAD